jgi:hypothetical protein
MKKVVKEAVHKHERTMHPGKPLTKLAKGGKTALKNSMHPMRMKRGRG